MKASLIITILMGVFLTNSAIAEVEPIPKAFHGKWVGVHDGTRITRKDAINICDGSYDNNYQNRAWIWIFDNNKSEFRSIAYYEDVSTYYPISYSKYSSHAIKGEAKVIFTPVSEERETFNDDFDFTLKDNKLYLKYVDSENKPVTAIFFKCLN